MKPRLICMFKMGGETNQLSLGPNSNTWYLWEKPFLTNNFTVVEIFTANFFAKIVLEIKKLNYLFISRFNFIKGILHWFDQKNVLVNFHFQPLYSSSTIIIGSCWDCHIFLKRCLNKMHKTCIKVHSIIIFLLFTKGVIEENSNKLWSIGNGRFLSDYLHIKSPFT